MDFDKALRELRDKTIDDIERMTAETWGARALASYQLLEEEEDMAARLRRFCEGENYRQEALEHAAMVEDGGKLLEEIRHQVLARRERALQELRSVSAVARVGDGRTRRS